MSSRLLKGRSIPGKVLLTRRSDPVDDSTSQESSPNYERSFSYSEAGTSDRTAKAVEVLLISFLLINIHGNHRCEAVFSLGQLELYFYVGSPENKQAKQ